ncbi:MAG: hypothetical protein L0Y57_10720 [Beijerinckiaceae bacterium]|nr:hypothetical protein [Beijerinckiaceae bacterium]
MRRGQLLTDATSGNHVKPRTALVMQSDPFVKLPRAVICPSTTFSRGDTEEVRLYIDTS